MSTSGLEDLVLGGVAAGCSKTIAAPIERVKLLLQNQDENVRRGVMQASQRYAGIGDCFARVPREQGVLSLWRGNLANVMRYVPQMALNFTFKERFKALAGGVPRDAAFGARLRHNVAFGGAAGAASLTVVYPLDFARTRLAMDTGAGGCREFRGPLHCLRQTVRVSGWGGGGGVYTGFGVSCAAMTVARGLQFGLYDTVRDSPWMASAGFWGRFGVGYAVTVAVGMAVYPLDTVRRRMMMTSGAADTSGLVYRGAVDCARAVLAAEGPGAFFKGAQANVLRSLCGALVMVLFDDLKDLYVGWRGARAGLAGEEEQGQEQGQLELLHDGK
eukprot:g4665.t1